MPRFHRLASLVMVFALTGPPAVLSACLALCLGTGTPATTRTADPTSSRCGHAGDAAPAEVSAHAHHGASTSRAPEARLIRACSTCCADGPLALAAAPRVERTDAKTLGVAPAAAPAMLQANPPVRAVIGPRAAGPPPPAWVPVPLRI